MTAPISIRLRNLTARPNSLREAIGRDQQLDRLVRVLLRPNNHHLALVGQPGVGKSSLIETLALKLASKKLPHLPPKLYVLDTAPILSLFVAGDNPRSCFEALANTVSKINSAIIVIEDIQLLASDDPSRLELTLELLQIITKNPNLRLIVTTSETAFDRTFRDDYVFNRSFSSLHLAEVDQHSLEAILAQDAEAKAVDLEQKAVTELIDFGRRYGHGRALPDAALRLLEEATIKSVLDGHGQISASLVQSIVAEREGLPTENIDQQNHLQLSTLGQRLNQAVIGQKSAMRTISRTIVNAELGLGDDSKPRGSFLLLGPSGVGKTETAKALSGLVYNNPKALVRLDMSEYSEAHTAVRLIGSPPGYVGYEEGGQLTGAVSRQPQSLVLLDEIEKAHPKLFDVFLQLLDDGRLTDSSGKTVDFTHSLLLATSNIGSQEITTASQKGIDITSADFLRQTLLPILLENFRAEFINRFDAILVYQPLAVDQLVDLAKRELSKLGSKLQKHQISFDVPDQLLAELISADYNPLFGARPVKRLISQHFEMPIAEAIVDGQLSSDPVVITGKEPWLG